MEEPLTFAELSNARPSHDGARLAVRIETIEGPSFDVAVPWAEIENIVAHFAECAEFLKMDAPLANTFTPIPVSGLGFAHGRTPEETILRVRLAGFGLAFALASTQVAALGRDFARTAQTLSAEGMAQ